MNSRVSLLAAGALLLAGCTPVSLFPSFEGNATLVLKPRIESAGFRTQVTVSPYGQPNVHRLEVSLYTVANSTETPVLINGNPLTKTILNADLGKDVVFGNLRHETTYRAKSRAFTAADLLISTEDADSYTDIVVGTDDRPTVSNLKVKLINKVFSGEATASGVIVATGSLVPSGAETLQ